MAHIDVLLGCGLYYYSTYMIDFKREYVGMKDYIIIIIIIM
jgi:hypothetical protein